MLQEKNMKFTIMFTLAEGEGALVCAGGGGGDLYIRWCYSTEIEGSTIL